MPGLAAAPAGRCSHVDGRDAARMEVVFHLHDRRDDVHVRPRARRVARAVRGMTTERADTCLPPDARGRAVRDTDAGCDEHYASTPIRETFESCRYVGVPIRPLRRNGRRDAVAASTTRGSTSTTRRSRCCRAGRGRPRVPVADQTGERRDPAYTGRLACRRRRYRRPDDGNVSPTCLQEDLGRAGPAQRPERPLDRVGQLRLAVTQLEHALAARVTVEQAIGVWPNGTGCAARRVRALRQGRAAQRHTLPSCRATWCAQPRTAASACRRICAVRGPGRASCRDKGACGI